MFVHVDSRRRPTPPWATIVLVSACVLAYFWLAAQPPDTRLALLTRWGTVPSRLLDTSAPWLQQLAELRLLRLFSALFVHADWLHLTGNLLFLMIFGLSAEQAVGQPLSMLLPPDPSEETRKFFVSHERPTRLAEFDMIWVRPDGTSVPLAISYSPVCDQDGTMFAGKLIARDVTERVRAERHTEMMMAELNHRVKNTLATVQAIAQQTIVNAPDLPTFRESFLSRLLALSHTHNLLARDAWLGAPLSGLVNNELAPYRPDDARTNDARVCLQGDELILPPKHALALSMALHELATNAGKYGSLSVPEGRVSVTWTTRMQGQRPRLQLQWTETGGPAVVPPTRRGFGTRLINEGVPYELDGEVTLEFPPSGVTCTIDVPLEVVS